MSDPDNNFIQPSAPPLSHLQQEKRATRGLDRRVIGAIAAVSAVALGILFFAPTPQVNLTTPERITNAPGEAQTATAREGDTPFAASQRALARERAQDALAAFVERQIELEDQLNVAQWGQNEFDQAMALARDADLDFASERFEQALSRYEQAAQKMGDLLSRSNEIVDSHLNKALEAINARNVETATEALQAAQQIKPDHPRVAQLSIRLGTLPEVISLLRSARNHELAGRWEDAMDTYQQVLAKDAQTVGVAELQQRARSQQRDQVVAQHISTGFDALNQQRFDAARRSFNAALALEPDNSIALGGLAQVARDNDLDVIAAHRRNAERALSAEQWAEAEAAYDAILAMDSNVQFAVDGKRISAAHGRSQALLSSITANPTRLSSQTLYLQAQEIVAQTNDLSQRGPRLDQLLADAERLLVQYRDPVALTLRSDNATQITLSNVGNLGAFVEKTLEVRPGEYTIRGTANGCRDLYMKIEVIPGIQPVDLTCKEPL